MLLRLNYNSINNMDTKVTQIVYIRCMYHVLRSQNSSTFSSDVSFSSYSPSINHHRVNTQTRTLRIHPSRSSLGRVLVGREGACVIAHVNMFSSRYLVESNRTKRTRSRQKERKTTPHRETTTAGGVCVQHTRPLSQRRHPHI